MRSPKRPIARVLVGAIALGLGISACKETITEPIGVAAVVVNGGGGVLRLGQSVQLSTTLKSTEGWTLANIGVSWASSDVGKANISSTGQVTAVSRGPVTLTASAAGVTGTAAVTVIGVQSIGLAPDTLSVIVTQTRVMTATMVLDSGVTVTPVWRSLDTTIAQVDTAGRVTARTTTGFARVEVTAEDKKDTAVVWVVPVPVVSVVVSPDTATRTVGQTLQLAAMPKDSIGGALTGRVVTWTSSDTARASVSAAGLVTVKAAGTATITATVEGKTGSAALTLKVPAPIPQNRSIVYNNQANNVVRVSTTGAVSGALSAGVHPIQINDRLIFRGGFGDNRIYSSTLTGESKAVLINAFSFSPDLTASGTRLTFFDGDCGGNAHTVALANADGTNRQRLATICAITPPRWSPDNSAIAYQTEQGIEVYTVATGFKRSIISLSGNQELSGWRFYGNVSWSADGSRLSFAARTNIANQYCLFTVNVSGTGLEKLPETCTADIGYHDWDWATGTLALEMNSGANSFLSMFTESGAQVGTISNTTGATWPRWTRSTATVPVTSVAITPATSSVIVGATRQFVATLRDAAGNTLTGRAITWTTSNSDIFTVSNSGLVTAKGAGTATVTATSEGIKGTATMTVSVPVTGLWQELSSPGTSSVIRYADFDSDLRRVWVAHADGTIRHLTLASEVWQAVSFTGGPSLGEYTLTVDKPQNRVLLGWRGLGSVWSAPIGGGAITQLGTNTNGLETFDHDPWINPVTGNLMVFGGYGFGTFRDRLWRFSDNRWTEVSKTNPWPWGRQGPGIAVAKSAGALFVFGGQGNSSGGQGMLHAFLHSLWKLDLSQGTWTSLITDQLSPPSAAPAGRGNTLAARSDGSEVFLTYPEVAPAGTNKFSIWSFRPGVTQSFEVLANPTTGPAFIADGMKAVFLDESDKALLVIGNTSAGPRVFRYTLP